MIRQLLFRLCTLFRRSRLEGDMSRELRFHLERQIEDNVRAGMSLQDARYAALRAFGGMEQVKEECRDTQGLRLIEQLWQDLRHAARLLRKSPGFASVAVVTLALGIGANTAIFSVVHSVLLRPLPYQDSDRLVKIWETNPRANRWGQWVSYPDFRDWRQQNQVFEDVAGFRSWGWKITGGDHPEVLRGLFVTSNLFSLLGVQPMLGRSLLPEEDQPGHDPVVILSYGLWQRRFGSDPGLVGQTVKLDGQDHTVIGIMPPGFEFPLDIFETLQAPDVWIPFGAHPERQDRGSHNFRVVARLKPGVTIEQAQANMESIVRGIGQQYPGHRGRSATVAGLQRNATREVRPALLLLLAAIGLVLLIACANVANLQLARATARQRESAIRQALGAGRRRLIRQLLTESVLLALLGGAAGLLLAFWGVQFLVKLSPAIPRLQETTIDVRVLGFTLLLSLATGILFGLAPAFQGSRIDLNEALKESGTRSTAGSSRARTRSLLVIVEIALALMVLIGAGLLIRSFLLLQSVDPGFNPHNVLTAFISAPGDPRQQVVLAKEVIDRIEALPGVQAAGGATSSPLLTNDNGPFQVEGQPAPQPGDPVIYAERPKVTPGYFRALGIGLVEGRTFTWADNEDSLRVAVVNERLARQYWPGEDPLGKRVSIDSRKGEPVWRQVVGVVRDTKQDSLIEPMRPVIYVPLAQFPQRFLVLAVRAQTDPTSLAAALRREVMAVNKDQPVFLVQTMEKVISDSVSTRRFQTLLLGIFAAVAIVLATVGIYGVVSYTVNQRRHEIGLRMALGAQQGEVLRLFLRQGLWLALAGVGIGLASSLALSRLLSGLLYGVSVTDLTTFTVVPLVMIAVALGACYVPARRATRVDPMVALRYE
jgi:putative ABC transport system permease protein